MAIGWSSVSSGLQLAQGALFGVGAYLRRRCLRPHWVDWRFLLACLPPADLAVIVGRWPLPYQSRAMRVGARWPWPRSSTSAAARSRGDQRSRSRLRARAAALDPAARRGVGLLIALVLICAHRAGARPATSAAVATGATAHRDEGIGHALAPHSGLRARWMRWPVSPAARVERQWYRERRHRLGSGLRHLGSCWAATQHGADAGAAPPSPVGLPGCCALPGHHGCSPAIVRSLSSCRRQV